MVACVLPGLLLCPPLEAGKRAESGARAAVAHSHSHRAETAMPEKKTPRAPRPIRESTFLDDPTLYPEFRALTGKLPKLHAFRCGFHRHRCVINLQYDMSICIPVFGVADEHRRRTHADVDCSV